MRYTQSPQYVVHPGTGHTMHDDNQALPTVLTDEDINQLTWGVMEVLAEAGIAFSAFDANVAATYTSLRDSIGVLNRKGYGLTATAGGSANALTGSFLPAVTALVNGMTVQVRAVAANSSPTPTFTATGTAAKVVVKGNDLPLAPGDIAGGGHWITLQYDSTLDKWVLLNPATGVNVPVQGSQGGYSNLVISASGTNGVVNISVDEIVLSNGSGSYLTVRGASGTVSTTAAAGLGGIDTGATAANTWYAIWMVSNGASTGYIYSLNATSPTMPAGYTLKNRVGWFRTDSTGNKFPMRYTQRDKDAQWGVASGTNVTDWPLMSTQTGGAWTAVGVTAFCPPSASIIRVMSGSAGNSQAASVGSSSLSTSTIANMNCGSGANYFAGNFVADVLLESTNIYFASNAIGLRSIGWRDNL